MKALTTKDKEQKMKEQEYKNIEGFTKELSKMGQAIYMACDAEVAADVSLKVSKAIKLINGLVADNKELTTINNKDR